MKDDGPARWRIAVDRGGTFTDCIAFPPDGGPPRVVKVPSADDAPLQGLRRLLGLPAGAAVPPCELRLGTTLATNALLTRSGARTLLLITRGFADLPVIGTQARPDLFSLTPRRSPPLHDAVLEVDARHAADGTELERPDEEGLLEALAKARAGGLESVAVCLVNAWRNGELELWCEGLARRVGFEHVFVSHRAATGPGLLARLVTTLVDAHVGPALGRGLAEVSQRAPAARLLVMESSGRLTEPERLSAHDTMLSGPAGGVIAVAEWASRLGFRQAVGLDIGGTSTDACRVEGTPTMVPEHTVGDATVRARALEVVTIAAGGGSLCVRDGRRLRVGPESAGASPGPLAYGHPDARRPTLTDAYLTLGRLVPARLPVPVDAARAEAGFARLAEELGLQGGAREAAEGALEVADAAMAEALRELTLARGADVRDHALVAFGGAGGLHACALARRLGIAAVIFPPLAGALSAWGIAAARRGWQGARALGGAPLDAGALELARRSLRELESEAGAVIPREGSDQHAALVLRRAGSDTELPVPLEEASTPQRLRDAFHEEHRRRFGWAQPDRPLEVWRVELDRAEPCASPPFHAATRAPDLPGSTSVVFAGRLREVPLFAREALAAGTSLEGPALIADATTTLWLEPDFHLEVTPAGALVARIGAPADRPAHRAGRGDDPVSLQIMAGAFFSVASQMGRVLERTSVSLNVRERLDFSCALFDARGRLVANAPHVPVHLGAMGASVRALLDRHPAPPVGTSYAVNHPALGGSHLPDVTVVTPVHDEAGRLRAFVGNRAHHADIGGITPGSMPANSRSLAEEGVALELLPVVEQGRLAEDRWLAALAAGPHPARTPRENLADLEAQLAANERGRRALLDLAAREGWERVESALGHVLEDGAEKVRACLARLPRGTRAFVDHLDDGARLEVSLHNDGARLRVDFTGTSPPLEGNLNAPRAVTVACVLYVLRLLVGEPMLLNEGCLAPVELVIPSPSLLAPEPFRAVAGGNVETSQRLVDVLLAAFGVSAASQGTMNNLSFGNDRFSHYETLGGGAGGTFQGPGASAIHVHMTNTRLTDAEVLELRAPLRVRALAIRRGSGGRGRHPGGDGLVRELEALAPMTLSVLCERRAAGPFGLAGGLRGAPGRQFVNGLPVAGRARLELRAGDRLRVETPGGGGFGAPEDAWAAAGLVDPGTSDTPPA